MGTWHFYLGLKDEWRWYHLDDRGNVRGESDRGFAELTACMANAEWAGFTGQVFRVHTRARIRDGDTALQQHDALFVSSTVTPAHGSHEQTAR